MPWLNWRRQCCATRHPVTHKEARGTLLAHPSSAIGWQRHDPAVSGGGRGSHFGGPAGTTPPMLSSGGPVRTELVSKETMLTDRRKAHSRVTARGGQGSPERRVRGHPIFAESNDPKICCARQRSAFASGAGLLGAITSHGPSRGFYKPSRKSRGRPAETAGVPAAVPAMNAQRM